MKPPASGQLNHLFKHLDNDYIQKQMKKVRTSAAITSDRNESLFKSNKPQNPNSEFILTAYLCSSWKTLQEYAKIARFVTKREKSIHDFCNAHWQDALIKGKQSVAEQNLPTDCFLTSVFGIQ